MAFNSKQLDNILSWKYDRILDMIRPLKEFDNKAMPANKPELYQRYLETRRRERRSVDTSVLQEFEASLLVLDDCDLGDATSVQRGPK